MKSGFNANEVKLIKELLERELTWIEHELFYKYFCPSHMAEESKTIDEECDGYGLDKRQEVIKKLIEKL